MLVATGFMAALSVAALVSLSVIRNQAEVSGQQRREREAHFAALAGLAEARGELVALLKPNVTRYTAAMGGTGLKILFPGDALVPSGLLVNPLKADPLFAATNTVWYAFTSPSLSAPTPYNLGAAAVDASEKKAPDGTTISAYPDQNNVRFSVFLADNDDGDGNNQVDSDGRVWLISVGQSISGVPNSMPTQVVVRALVTNNNVDDSCGGNYHNAVNNMSDCLGGPGTSPATVVVN